MVRDGAKRSGAYSLRLRKVCSGREPLEAALSRQAKSEDVGTLLCGNGRIRVISNPTFAGNIRVIVDHREQQKRKVCEDGNWYPHGQESGREKETTGERRRGNSAQEEDQGLRRAPPPYRPVRAGLGRIGATFKSRLHRHGHLRKSLSLSFSRFVNTYLPVRGADRIMSPLSGKAICV